MNEPTPEEKIKFLIKKSEAICARNELCEFDVIQKLTAWKSTGSEVDQVLAHLREEGYVDNLRYAQAYAKGKNHQLKWGRTKIAYQLKMKRIDQNTIDQALWLINEEEYLEQLAQIAAQKWRTIHEEDEHERTGKLTMYLQSKGYELYAIKKAIARVTEQSGE